MKAINTRSLRLEDFLEVGKADLDTELERAKWLAYWQDSRFNVLGIRFGADAILGLIPGIGDTISAVSGLYPVLIANRHRLGADVQARMLANLGVDLLVGTIPILGDVFDVVFKANKKNLAILEKAVLKKRGTPE